MYCKECGAELRSESKYCLVCGAPVAPHAAQPPARAARHGARHGVATLLLSLLVFFLSVVLEVPFYLIGDRMWGNGEVCAIVGMAVGAVVGICALGGRDIILTNRKKLWYALKKSWWLMLVTVGLLAFDLVSVALSEEFQVIEGWPLRLASVTVLCVAVGLSEEMAFRGVLLGGFLDPLGRSRKGVCIAVVIASLLYGLAHVDFVSIDFADGLQALQAVLKTLQTGILGFFFATIAIESKNVMGTALVHGLMDFLLLFTSVVLLDMGTDVSYVNSGDEAVSTIILYAIMIVLYLPLLVSGIRSIRRMAIPEHGAFHKDA